MFLLPFFTMAKLKGIYTINPKLNADSINYISITDALNDISFGSRISSGKVNGPNIDSNVIFVIAKGNYKENLDISSVVSNSKYTITFRSAGNDSSEVVIHCTSAINQNYNFSIRLENLTVWNGYTRLANNVIFNNCLLYGNSATENLLQKCTLNHCEVTYAKSFGTDCSAFFTNFVSSSEDGLLDPFIVSNCTIDAPKGLAIHLQNRDEFYIVNSKIIYNTNDNGTFYDKPIVFIESGNGLFYGNFIKGRVSVKTQAGEYIDFIQNTFTGFGLVATSSYDSLNGSFINNITSCYQIGGDVGPPQSIFKSVFKNNCYNNTEDCYPYFEYKDSLGLRKGIAANPDLDSLGYPKNLLLNRRGFKVDLLENKVTYLNKFDSLYPNETTHDFYGNIRDTANPDIGAFVILSSDSIHDVGVFKLMAKRVSIIFPNLTVQLKALVYNDGDFDEVNVPIHVYFSGEKLDTILPFFKHSNRTYDTITLNKLVTFDSHNGFQKYSLSQSLKDYNKQNDSFSNYLSLYGIKDYKQQTSITISPNPTSSTFSIQTNNVQNGETTITLRNYLGQIVQIETIQINGNLNYQTDLNQLPKGVYFVELQQGNFRGIGKVIYQ